MSWNGQIDEFEQPMRPVLQRGRLRRRGSTSTVAVVALTVGFACGLGASALWIHRAAQPGLGPDQPVRGGAESAGLSEGTKAVLRRLQSPLELRFYSVFDPATAPEPLKSFTHRVDQLLTSYQHEAEGKLRITRVTGPAYANARGAMVDGIKPLSTGGGEDCFLGIAILSPLHKESLPQLAPEWEAALEIDITRAIANTAETVPATSTVLAAKPKSNSATIDEVKVIVANADSVSLEEGTRLLRQAALKEFTKAAAEGQAELKSAQERLSQAQAGGNEAEQQAAVKRLQEVQAMQANRLKEIAAKSQEQVDAFHALKGAVR